MRAEKFLRGIDPLAASIAMVALGLLAGLYLLPVETSDYTDYFHPWMDQIYARGWKAIAADFADYNPPYVYLMALVSGLSRYIGPLATLKIANIPFIILCGIGIGRIVLHVTGDRARAMLASASIFVLPTQVINSFAWGQCDIIYTSLLVWALYAVLVGKQYWFGALMGVALAFKLQTIFLAPFALFLVVNRRVSIGAALVALAAFCVALTPAWAAGRPLGELFTVYLSQADFSRALSFSAPNAWSIVEDFKLLDYEFGFRLGLILTVLGSLAIGAVGFEKQPFDDRHLILIAAVSAALTPYLLPKMHDRYFFPADVLLVVVAFVRPSLWPLAVLGQFGSLSAYVLYFNWDLVIPGRFKMLHVGMPAYPIVIGTLAYALYRRPRGEGAAPGLPAPDVSRVRAPRPADSPSGMQ